MGCGIYSQHSRLLWRCQNSVQSWTDPNKLYFMLHYVKWCYFVHCRGFFVLLLKTRNSICICIAAICLSIHLSIHSVMQSFISSQIAKKKQPLQTLSDAIMRFMKHPSMYQSCLTHQTKFPQTIGWSLFSSVWLLTDQSQAGSVDGVCRGATPLLHIVLPQ